VLLVSGKPSWGIPDNRSLGRSLYFWSRSAAVNPGGQLDGDGIVPQFPYALPVWLYLDPYLFVFLSGTSTGESWRRDSASLITAALRKLNPHMAAAPPHILFLLLISSLGLIIVFYQKG